MNYTFTATSLLNDQHNAFITNSISDENECRNLELCAICNNKFIPLNFYNSETAFASTCLKCTNTCWQCGGDIGFAKSTIGFISNEICFHCDHSCCKSCGINIECNKCGYVICSGCVDNGKGCGHCNQIMKSLRKRYNDVN